MSKILDSGCTSRTCATIALRFFLYSSMGTFGASIHVQIEDSVGSKRGKKSGDGSQEFGIAPPPSRAASPPTNNIKN